MGALSAETTIELVVTDGMKKELRNNGAEKMIANRINGSGDFTKHTINDILWAMWREKLSRAKVIEALKSNPRVIQFFEQVSSDPAIQQFFAELESQDLL